MNRTQHILITAIVAIAISPSTALARAAETTSGTRTPATSQDTSARETVCAKLETRAADAAERFQEAYTARTLTRDTEASARIAARQEAAATRAAARQAVDTQASTNEKALEGMATMEAQRQAVTDFVTAKRTALTARRQAVDAAHATYQQGLDALLAARGTQNDAAVATRAQAIAAARTEAASQCADSSISLAEIRSAFTSALQTAQRQYAESRATGASFASNHRTLIQARNEAVKAANATFRSSMEAARTTLLAAFPES